MRVQDSGAFPAPFPAPSNPEGITAIEPDRKIDLSVVIPSYNRRHLLSRCLDSLVAQERDPSSFEVVVVDDGSSDGTTEMLEDLETPFELRLLRQSQGGWARAQNAGIEASEGEICLLIDDDIVASPGLVEAHVAGHAAQAGVAIGIGPLTQVPPRGRDWYARAFATEWDKHYAVLAERPATWMDCYGGNLSAPRAALLASGGFAADLAAAADVELAFRICEAGAVPTFLPDADALHDDQKPGSRLIRDARSRGVAYLQMSARHPAAEADLLGTFDAASPREIAVRRLLIALRARPGALAAIGAAAPGAGSKAFLHHAIGRYAFWQSVRREVDDERWRQLTRDGFSASDPGQAGGVTRGQSAS